jgi:hypothetical protein
LGFAFSFWAWLLAFWGWCGQAQIFVNWFLFGGCFFGWQNFCVILQFFGNSQKQEQKSKPRAVFKKQKRATI